MAILVTGGAGYIGSVVVEDLSNKGETVIVIDNLVAGHRPSVDAGIPFYVGNIGDKRFVREILAGHEITACMHFSALASVGESVEDPQRYFENNFTQTMSLLDVLREFGIARFVFSSTCATYGEPQYTPIDEKHPQWPASPYGWSKLMVERALEASDAAYGLKFVALRYFNAAGATAARGEHHEPETHLIPLVLSVARGDLPFVPIFGSDYPTPDGTAIRDYIHVSDISSAHLLALDHLDAGRPSEFINLGNGNGYSVTEVIDAARRVTGLPIAANTAPRRSGDPSRLIANCEKAGAVLGWVPKFSALDEIIESSWVWHQANPHGYTD